MPPVSFSLDHPWDLLMATLTGFLLRARVVQECGASFPFLLTSRSDEIYTGERELCSRCGGTVTAPFSHLARRECRPSSVIFSLRADLPRDGRCRGFFFHGVCPSRIDAGTLFENRLLLSPIMMEHLFSGLVFFFFFFESLISRKRNVIYYGLRFGLFIRKEIYRRIIFPRISLNNEYF